MPGYKASTFVAKVAIYYTVQFIRTVYNLITKILASMLIKSVITLSFFIIR